MRKIKTLLIVVIMFFFPRCQTSSHISYMTSDYAKEETLILLYSKIIDRGSFYFLSDNGTTCRLTVYSYHFDKKTKKTSYSKIRVEDYNFEDSCVKNLSWLNADLFKTQFLNNEYFKQIFPPNFLDLSNDEKMSLFENLSRQ